MASDCLEAALGMEVEEDRDSKGKDECGGTLWAMVSLEFLTQDSETSGTTLVYTLNGFNKLSPLVMLWTVRHRWPAGARFAFKCYRHWEQLLL